MVRTIAQIQALLLGEINAEGNRRDSNKSISPFTLLRDLIESIDSMIDTQIGLRVGSEAVVTGGTAIMFSSVLPSINYSTSGVRCFDGSGDKVGYALTNKAVGGFTITPAIDCTCDYIIAINT